ncbi:hypothetical protein CHLRE_14g615000v5 [Chlamydomonas reinhardtii]|uniref:Peptide-methionine (R)-S-oxide reductase n=1 Tax=Chlamydomonas reinhardtii TaxID=3055 RepID=A0A2K3CXI9_CHLRE|nr:uncharacterized protein CHLRE_14g615000v5 [Chlamydomonas reinhardtii]PNW73001.1 hypothetical protein CHLRE_14g615000v5 [Chlamydomonas reinhardtii]
MQTIRALNSRALASAPRRSAIVLQPRLTVRAMASSDGVKLDKSTPDSVWKTLLNAEEFHILRQKGTERAGTGKYNKFYEEGTYKCAGCGTPLYKSETKFNSGCGWPAFYDEIPGAVDRHVDNTFGMRRVEITCANCGGHLGHVFEGEGFPTPTDQRHCVNSVSIKFDPKP